MKGIFTFILFMFFCNLFSQEKVVKKYDNGNILYEGYIVNNTLDSIYKEYYPSGNLKKEGFYKNCEFKTNNREIVLAGCGVESNKDIIKAGKLNGIWKEFYENNNLKSISNYFCGIMHGNFFNYLENGNIESIDFYDANRKVISQSFNSNQTLIEIQYFDVKWIKDKKYETTRTIEFYENENYKSETLVEEKEDGYKYETYKEYYSNGFQKIEEIMIEGDKHGICYQYYENGNVKQVGCYEYGKPVYVQLFYNENGSPQKIETWKKGKLIKSENGFDPKKSFKYKVKKYKD